MTVHAAADCLPNVPGFKVEKVLGRGGAAVVYKARQIDPPRLVALKLFRAQAGGTALARFRGEADALTRLRHPHVVEVYAVGEYAGGPYLVMEFCAGSSLDNRLLGQPLTPRAAATLAATLARAVQHCHELGVIHRDLKPANVLLSDGPDGNHIPKIADFGLAKVLDDESNLTRSGIVLGTIGFMAPEQAAGQTKHVGPAADIWALGAILYQLLTGNSPFFGANDPEILAHILEDDPEPPDGPPGLVAICFKCLRKRPEERYTTAGELADDLDRWLRDEPTQAELAPPPTADPPPATGLRARLTAWWGRK
jgi:serine/threonine-protein kinase